MLGMCAIIKMRIWDKASLGEGDSRLFKWITIQLIFSESK